MTTAERRRQIAIRGELANAAGYFEGTAMILDIAARHGGYNLTPIECMERSVHAHRKAERLAKLLKVRPGQ